MKLITTKREHNASIKFIKKACEEIRPLVKDEKTVAKINQLLATPMLWDDVADMLKTPIIVDEDGSAIYLDGETIVIDVPEVVGLKGLGIAEHMLGFVSAVAKPIGAILVTAGAPVLGVLILFGALANSASFLTHYGCGVTPIFFGANYMGQGRWWKIGFIIATIHLIVWLGIGLPWMKAIGFF